jgi:hypothetical protein
LRLTCPFTIARRPSAPFLRAADGRALLR